VWHSGKAPPSATLGESAGSRSADELVVLGDDLAGALGEVEREGGLVGAEVVDVEDELLGQVLLVAPDARTSRSMPAA
jgi:hypothetical protein